MSWGKLVVFLGMMGLLGFLYFSPPRITVAYDADPVGCRPIGWGSTGSPQMDSPLLGSTAAVTTYVETTYVARDAAELRERRAEAEASLAAACDDARSGRQTQFFAVIAAGLALLVLGIPRGGAPLISHQPADRASSDAAPADAAEPDAGKEQDESRGLWLDRKDTAPPA
ncbi:MAG: hypothetical protein ACTMIR_07600 [Cellulomonadaceae bacterium]